MGLYLERTWHTWWAAQKEHRSGSPFSDSPWFKEQRNSNLSRKPPYNLNFVKGGMGFKWKSQQGFAQEAQRQGWGLQEHWTGGELDKEVESPGFQNVGGQDLGKTLVPAGSLFIYTSLLSNHKEESTKIESERNESTCQKREELINLRPGFS